MFLRITKKCKCGCGDFVKRNSSDWLSGHRTTEVRFFEKIDKRGAYECWPWKGANTGKAKGYGHGRFYVKGRLSMATHYLFQTLGKKIPNGSYVLHKCDNPSCMNPKHLYIGTLSENMFDMYLRKRVDRTGENHGRSKLNWSVVKEIRSAFIIERKKGYKRVPEGFSIGMANKYGVSLSAIQYVCRNKSWINKDYGHILKELIK